jgi:hypothetical protein
MATHRPNAAIYQEYKTLSFTPATPTLHTVIVGPCYQILDYLDDKDDCLVDDDYGVLEDNCPVTTTPALVVADPPGMLPGAILDDDSVGVFFDEGHAVVCAWSGTGDNALFLTGDNLFKGGAVHFGELGVQAGDRLVVNPHAPAIEDYKNTVKELAYTLTVAAATFVTDGVTAGDLLTLSIDAAATPRNGTYTVKRVVDETHLEIEDDDAFTGASATANLVITNSAGTTTKVSLAATLVVDTCYLRITDDFATDNDGTNKKWRVEREFHDKELLSTDFSVDSTTKVITIKAGVTVDLGTAAPLLANAVTYAKAYVEYRALRRDLQQINEVSQDTAVMAALLGKLDARNPLHVGAYLAALNTLTTVKVFGLKSDDLVGYMDFVSKISNERHVYAVAPLTYDTSVLGFLNTMAMTLADPDYVLTNGIRQKFRVVLGAIDLPTFKYVVDPTDTVTTSQVLGTKPLAKGLRTLTYTAGAGPSPAAAWTTTDGVIPGDIVTITDMPGGTIYQHTVAHVKAANVLEVDPDGLVLIAHTMAAGDKFKITSADGLTTRFGELTYAAATCVFTLTSDVLDDLFLVLTVPGATFVTDGVLPGDLVQMSSDPMTSTFTTFNSWVVDDVISETRIQVMNEGTDTPTVENELPHEGWRGGGKIVVQGTMIVRVIRYYTAAQQVTEMLATAHSFSSRRLVLCYPYQLEIAYLKDGSLDRGTKTDPIDALPDQPGYYLACCVGGQTSGQPSQQGFTFLGVNGVRRIYGSNDYFSEEQLTELSNGGIYVFTQESLASLPSTIHEVTTDVSTLEFSEYMCIKNFDYISWTFLDTILDFIGKWNVTEETIQFLGQAEQANIETLKSQRKPRIGAPLIDASITSNEISSISADRIEAYIDVNMPMTLNTIGCHLVG